MFIEYIYLFTYFLYNIVYNLVIHLGRVGDVTRRFGILINIQSKSTHKVYFGCTSYSTTNTFFFF